MSYPLITIYAPGTRPDLIAKAAQLDVDAIIVDLEDTVPPSLKAETRCKVGELVPTIEKPPLVRVNNEPGLLAEDLKAVASGRVRGIVLPMADSVEQVKVADQVLTAIEAAQGLAPHSIIVILQIESALGVMRTFELATAVARVESVSFGSAEDGDLQRDLGCGYSIEGTEMLYARSRVLLEARAAGLPYVLDGAFSNIRDLDAFRADCSLSKRLGYDGRTLIHPGQVSVARDGYRLSETQLAHYRRVLEAFEAAQARGEASIQVDGKLIDYAMYKQAVSALGRADRS